MQKKPENPLDTPLLPVEKIVYNLLKSGIMQRDSVPIQAKTPRF